MKNRTRSHKIVSFLKLDWCGLSWVPWIRLKAGRNERKTIPKTQGVYRVRPNKENFLVYVGQTTNLKNRTSSLASNSYKQEMPWNDPHTAAPNLWAWRQEKGWDYEVSVASTPELTRQNREGLECLLLWQYRLEKGESTPLQPRQIPPRLHQTKQQIPRTKRKKNRPK